MKRKRFARLLCSARLVLVLCLSALPAFVLGGCGGGGENAREPAYTPSFERQVLIQFKPEVTEAERTAIYDRYFLRLLGPFGDRPNSYLLLLRDDKDPVQTDRSLEQEPGVVGAAFYPVGPF